MRFSSAGSLVLAAAAAPVAVSAAGMFGYCLGNNKATDGSCKVQADYEDDFDALSPVTKIVRVYTSGGTCNTAAEILPAAVAKGFEVVLGVWPDTEDSYQADKSALQTVMKDSSLASAVHAITVGSEAMYRLSQNQGGMTATDLLAKIQDIKSTFPDVKVGTVDSWNIWADGTGDPILSATPTIELVMANGFSYWQGQPPANASHSYIDDMFQAFTHIQEVTKSTDIELWTGETGWPGDGGSDYETVAVAGTANEKQFYQSGVCAALDWNFNVFYFEAFDEPFKPNATGQDGSVQVENHWGMFNADRTIKFTAGC